MAVREALKQSVEKSRDGIFPGVEGENIMPVKGVNYASSSKVK